MLKNIYKFFTSILFAGILMLALAVALAVATFLENDFGTMTVQKVIYKARWFEILWLLFALSLIINIFRFRLYRKSKSGIFIFHLAMIVIILGAAVTRYTGYEGIMPIREGQTASEILSDETYIQVEITDGADTLKKDFRVLFGSLGKNKFEKTIRFKDKEYRIELKRFYPSAGEKPVEDKAGKGLLYLVRGTSAGRSALYLKENHSTGLSGFNLGFNAKEKNEVNIFTHNDSLKIIADFPFMVMHMSDQRVDTMMPGVQYPFEEGALYMLGNESLVLKEYMPHAKLVPVSTDKKIQAASINALEMSISDGKENKTIYVWGNKGMEGQKAVVDFGRDKVAVSYGSKRIKLPFGIKLRDFQLDRYPGSMSPSSYASEVTLIDPEKNLVKDFRIYMNHVLDYKGYRFFQSSYDPDEKGTILSVNHDFWGTWITYLGYFLLTLGMIITFFNSKSRVKKLNRLINKYREKRNVAMLIFPLVFAGTGLYSQEILPDSFKIINKKHAAEFGKMLVQERGGRIMPFNTMSGMLIRKVVKKNKFLGQNPDQIILGMMVYPHQWQDVPMIKINHPQLREYIGVGKYASYIDFFDDKSGYILQHYIEEAIHKPEKERSKFDKEVIKVDERLNIVYMIFSGSFLRIFPKQGDSSRKWYNMEEASKMDFGEADVLVKNFLPWYLQGVAKGQNTGDWNDAMTALEGLRKYQKSLAYDYMPSESRVKAELLYNKARIFSRLAYWYFIIGFILLIILLLKVFKPSLNVSFIKKTGMIMIFAGFIVHTAGLALRWYISGHAPWSDGYESMIYIAWAIVLAGILLSKKSPITLAATAVLAAWIMIVAAMNWMDPQITNLVPVLKSYWLMIHVSVITASYGFLFLSAMLGLINLVMMIISGRNNKDMNVTYTIKELTAVNELSMTIGLFLLSIGTFLGGIWANESWGRYWGWDAKETWSLIAILVYSFVVHMRKIKGLKSVFAFNLASVWASFAILMTYFGVNFYLSGLHSYAKGDPVPIPAWVYISVFSLILLSTLAYYRHNEKEILE